MFSILPFRKGEEAFLDIVKASAKRKAEADKRVKFYFDEQTDSLYQEIAAKWSEPDDFRLFQINVVKKIINRLASVYSDWPTRTFEGANQERMDDLYRYMRANVEMKKASRMVKLLKSGALQVGHDGTGPTLAFISPAILDVVHDGDPERPTRIIVTHRAAKSEDVTYSDWTADTYTRRDWRGVPIPSEGNPDGVNPYGILPFVPLFDRAPDDVFFLNGGADLIEAQEAINIGLANLWRALEWQSHGQPVATGVNRDDYPVEALGPTHVVAMPEGGDFKFVQPNAPLTDVRESVEWLIRQTAVANDLSASTFELDGKAESGAAKLAERTDLAEARRDDLELSRGFEHRLFEVLRVVVNTHSPGSIPEAARFSIDFADPSDGVTEMERMNAAQARVALGVWNAVDVLMNENPDIQSRADAMKLLLEKQEENAMIGNSAPFMG